jgi:Ca2+/H+ antiporter, TMEM165/GDT1 family
MEEAIATEAVTTTGNDTDPPTNTAGLAGLGDWWKVFASTYITIFLAEIGDKTQVTTLLMSAESHKPWLVFAGAGTALICTSLLGVLLGRWLANRLKPRTLELGAGITLLIITAGLGWDIFQGLS